MTAPEATMQSAPVPNSPLCAVCQSAMEAEDEQQACPACETLYHAECWQENQGCAIYGCEAVPVMEKLTCVEIPLSHWGQERKACPVCKADIQAAAVRCRHCGALFSSVQPMDAAIYRQQLDCRLAASRNKRVCIGLFVACLLPMTAPLALLAALCWYKWKRQQLRTLPQFYAIIVLIGAGVALLETLAIVACSLLVNALAT